MCCASLNRVHRADGIPPQGQGQRTRVHREGALRDRHLGQLAHHNNTAAHSGGDPAQGKDLEMPDEDIDDEQLDDDEAKKLLAAAVDDDNTDDDSGTDDDSSRRDTEREKGDETALRDPGKRALDSMKRERNTARKELADIRAKLKTYEDQGKSESQRLQEARDEAATRAAQAEERHRALSVAMDRAPAHATLAQVRAVAKRVRGENDDELETDADELFELLAPAAPAKDDKPDSRDRKVAGRPRERLRGGGDPEEDAEESDPRKLADLIRRR